MVQNWSKLFFFEILIFFSCKNGDPSKTNEFEQPPPVYGPSRSPRVGPTKSKVNAMNFLRAGMKIWCFENHWKTIGFSMIFDENSIRNVIKNLNDFGVRRADPEDFQWSRGGPMLRTFCKNRLYVWLFWVGHFDHLSNGFWRFFHNFIIVQFCRSRKNDWFSLDRWPFVDVHVVHAIPFCIFFKKISWSHLAQSGFSSGYTSIPNGRSIRV